MRLSLAFTLLLTAVVSCGPSTRTATSTGTVDSGVEPDGGVAGRCVPLVQSGQQPPFHWFGTGDGGVPLSQFVQDYASAWCSAFGQCNATADSALADCVAQISAYGQWTMPATCKGTSSSANEIFCSAEQIYGFLAPQLSAEAATGGAVVYRPDRAAACLASPWPKGCLSGTPGLIDPQEPAACQMSSIFEGTLALGASCQADSECVSGFCTNDASCAGGLCADGGSQGGSDGGGDAGCLFDEDCPAGLSCGQRGTSTSDGSCVRLAQAGEPCSDSSSCGPPLVCVGSSAADAGVCQQLPEVGQPCLQGLSDLPIGCMEGLTCSCGVCELAPPDGTACEPPAPDGGAYLACRNGLSSCSAGSCTVDSSGVGGPQCN